MREAQAGDAESIAALATLVFLDTYVVIAFGYAVWFGVLTGTAAIAARKR